MSEPFIGEIRAFGFNFAPRGWAFCDGNLISIQENTALFSLLGTSFGGDGRTNFALPDLRGRSMIKFGGGPGMTPVVFGERGGLERQTLHINQMPAHTHDATLQNPTVTLGASSQNADYEAPGPSEVLADMHSTAAPHHSIWAYKKTKPDTTIGGIEIEGGSVEISKTGENMPIDNRPPFLAINYCIALVGVYPQRK